VSRQIRISTVLRWVAGLSVIGLIVALVSGAILPFYFRGIEMLLFGVGMLIPFSLIGLCCAATLERGRVRGLMRSGLWAAALAWVGMILAFWMEEAGLWDAYEIFGKLAGSITLWASYCMVVALLMRYRIRPMLAWTARFPTLVIASILLFVSVITVLTDGAIWANDDVAIGFFTSAIMLVVIGLTLTLILARMRELTGELDEGEEAVPQIDFTLWCPRCETEQPYLTGAGHCRNCGLAIKVTPT
jgi:hypothetical protein